MSFFSWKPEWDGMEIDDIDEIVADVERGWADELDRVEAKIAILRGTLEQATHLLGELQAVVRGECPSLFNEDSGGDAELDLQIDDWLRSARSVLEDT
jgi:hypothetical protein